MARRSLVYLLVAVLAVVLSIASIAVIRHSAAPTETGRMSEVLVLASPPVLLVDTVVVSGAAVPPDVY